ncbi:hypothetical protein Tco_0589028 [Tanacetum coccineum]
MITQAGHRTLAEASNLGLIPTLGKIVKLRLLPPLTPSSTWEVPSFDGPEEPQPLLNSPSLDVIFDEKKLRSSLEVSLDNS